MKNTQFTAELESNIKTTIRRLRAVGTVGMGIENLRQVTPTPRATDGAPMGGNVQWQYAQMFREVCQSSRAIAAFLI